MSIILLTACYIAANIQNSQIYAHITSDFLGIRVKNEITVLLGIFFREEKEAWFFFKMYNYAYYSIIHVNHS